MSTTLTLRESNLLQRMSVSPFAISMDLNTAGRPLNRQVMKSYLAGTRLSILILRALSPASLNGTNFHFNVRAFVVIATVSIPGIDAISLTISTQSFLTVGSPPVILTLLTPALANIWARVLISSH